MKQTGQVKKILEEIIESKEFDRLEPYKNPDEWPTLDNEEKELLARVLIMHGEHQLQNGDQQVLESFRLANQLAPNNIHILYRQAITFGQQNQNQYCLKASCHIFETILSLKPNFFEAKYGLANALVLLGVLNHENSFFEQALHIYQEVSKKADQIPTPKLIHFYKDMGLCWYSIGKYSGEPNDFKNAVASFRKASKLGLNDCYLWNDYGNALFNISELINKMELAVEAVELYWKAIKLQPEFVLGWHNLASALLYLYRIYPQETYFTLANESFEQISKFDPKDASAWTKWGELLLFKGKVFQDLQLLKEACSKFEAADFCESNHPSILSGWIESLILLGRSDENLDYLREAQNKIIKSIELQSDLPRNWYLYGNCLVELGKYFDDEHYYLDAIEKYQFGLTLNSSDCLLWFGLAEAYMALGLHNEDAGLLSESSQTWMRGMGCGGQKYLEAWNGWGQCLFKLAGITGEKKYLQSALNKFEQAIRQYKHVGPIEYFDLELLFNYGSALELFADTEDDFKSYEKALLTFKRIQKTDPEYYPAIFHIAYLNSRIAESTDELDHYAEANHHFEKYLQAIPDDDHAWGEWGITLLNMAELVKEPARPDVSGKLYSQAESRLMQAAFLGNDAVLYTLACLYSLTDNETSCLEYLEKCRIREVLPPLEDLMADHWLDNMRGHPEFKLFLSRLN